MFNCSLAVLSGKKVNPILPVTSVRATTKLEEICINHIARMDVYGIDIF